MLPDRARIGLVEDDPVMGGSIVQRLELEGWHVTWWQSGQRGDRRYSRGRACARPRHLRHPASGHVRRDSSSTSSPSSRTRRPSCSSPAMARSTRRSG